MLGTNRKETEKTQLASVVVPLNKSIVRNTVKTVSSSGHTIPERTQNWKRYKGNPNDKTAGTPSS